MGSDHGMGTKELDSRPAGTYISSISVLLDLVYFENGLVHLSEHILDNVLNRPG